MRRSNREIKSFEDTLNILKRCDVIRLGINTPDYPYVVPMNFGFESNGNALTLWLHCAKEGLKLNLINQNCRVGFEADCSHRLLAGEAACEYTMEYESVIGCGDIYICNDNQDKQRGLKSIMEHYEPEKEFTIPEQMLASVCVLRVDVMQITGKQLKKNV